MNIYFLRHGQTTWNKRKRLQGSVDIPLSDEGIRQAQLTEEATKEIPFDVIYTSSLKRACATAHVMRGEREIPIIRDDRIREIHFGILEGRKLSKINDDPRYIGYRRLFQDISHYHPPKHAESMQEVMNRIMDFYQEEIIPLEGKAENVLIVAHGAIIRTFIMMFNERPLEEFWKTPFGQNCSMALFECKQGKTEMICENKVYYQDEKYTGVM